MNSFRDWLKGTTGKGVITPFSRTGGNDFKNGYGAALVNSALSNIVGIQPGEIPWRPDFGTNLEQFRHKNGREQMYIAAANEIISSIARWEPRVEVTKCTVGPDESQGIDSNTMLIRLDWRLIDNPVQGASSVSETGHFESAI